MEILITKFNKYFSAILAVERLTVQFSNLRDGLREGKGEGGKVSSAAPRES